MPSQISPWIGTLRPKTLPASISPILVGNSLAFGAGLKWDILITSLICALLLQIAVNFANDLFDRRSGVDTEKRVGPNRGLQTGAITPKALWIATGGTLLLAFVIGLYLIWVGGWVFVALGLASIVGVLWYSGGPYPLASLGLGEVTVFLFFGPVAVLGVEYLQLSMLSPLGILNAVQMGAFSAAIMLVNNIRDIETDTMANKKTLAVRLGDSKSRSLYRFLVLIPVLIQAGIFLLMGHNVAAVLPFLCLPLVFKCIQSIESLKGAGLNNLLAGTAKTLLVFSLLIITGRILSI